jgi:tetratricopeptide (TPR) repeat protein
MDMFKHFSPRLALYGCTFLLCFSLSAQADEIQEINKLFKQGQQEQALGRINTYLTSKPKDAQARFLKGLILTEQNKTNEAIRVFSDLTEDFPELPEPYNNLAVLYASQGQYDKARIALEMAIRTHPSYATAHENLGDIYAKMASQAYDRALQLDHSNTSTQTKLAMVKEIFAAGTAKNGKTGKPVHKLPADTATTSDGQVADSSSVAPTSMVAAAPSTQASTVTTSNNNGTAVLRRVNAWAAAWSAKNVKEYLAFYAEDFKVPGNAKRADWETQRNDRISKPKSIEVTIIKPTVQFIDANHASVTFKQNYSASHLHATSSKTLVFEKSGDSWLIQEEITGN